jgi:hypothetical protein
MIRLRADFNELFGDMLCISHSDTATDEHGAEVALERGMLVAAFEQAMGQNGEAAFLVARGSLVRSSESMKCEASRWCLQIDGNGVRCLGSLCDA